MVTRAKDLCSYIMTVTQKSPKNFRYTYVSRLQNLAMDCLCVISNNFMLASTLSVFDKRFLYGKIILGWSIDLGPSAGGEVPRHFIF